VPNKIKIALTLVAVVAMFLVYQLAKYVDSVANGNSTYQQGDTLPTPDDDPDHDGLNNQQEIIWGADPFNPDTDGDGFKDGEEVKSGHNPLIPGPDDLINTEDLTLQFSELAVAGLIAGDLQPESPNFDKELDQISTEVVDSARYLFYQDINNDALTITETSKKSNEKYVVESMPLIKDFVVNLNDQYSRLEENLNIIGRDGFNNQNLNKFYTDQEAKYSNLLREGLLIETPKAFSVAHAQFLSLIQRTKQVSEAIRDGDKDPVKAMLAFDVLGETYTELIDFVMAYDQVLSKSGLDDSLVNNLFK
jgi:hypothetical protein